MEQLGDPVQGIALRHEAAAVLIQARDRRRAVEVLEEIGQRLEQLGEQTEAREAWTGAVPRLLRWNGSPLPGPALPEPGFPTITSWTDGDA